jgi:hypothetical protein
MAAEKKIEQKFLTLVRNAGGFVVKLTGHKGIPDRLVLINGRVSFIEFKAPDGRLSPAQQYVIQQLKNCGGHVGVFTDADEAFAFCTCQSHNSA